MDLNEFERQVLAGEITDFRPYFTKPYDKEQMEQRYILAKNGVGTDRVSEMTVTAPLSKSLTKDYYRSVMTNGNIIHAQVSVEPWLTTTTFGIILSTMKTHIFGNRSSNKTFASDYNV